ncbi:MAG: hypothetical protein AAF195_02855 [Pseudomonadota bacterium]
MTQSFVNSITTVEEEKIRYSDSQNPNEATESNTEVRIPPSNGKTATGVAAGLATLLALYLGEEGRRMKNGDNSLALDTARSIGSGVSSACRYAGEKAGLITPTTTINNRDREDGIDLI